MKNAWWLMAALTLGAMDASAGEAEARKALEESVGKVERIARSPAPGFWEGVVDGQIFYIDDSGRYLFAGGLVDLKTGRNLTSERQFAMLPLNLALKQVRGSGKNVLVTFEDPNCGYCKKLAQELQSVKDVTIYTFLYPVLGEDSYEKSKAIWCSADRVKAWNAWMLQGTAVGKAGEKCDLAGLKSSMELGHKLRINGTPAMIFGNGDRVPGYLPAAEIEKRFAAVAG